MKMQTVKEINPQYAAMSTNGSDNFKKSKKDIYASEVISLIKMFAP